MKCCIYKHFPYGQQQSTNNTKYSQQSDLNFHLFYLAQSKGPHKHKSAFHFYEKQKRFPFSFSGLGFAFVPCRSFKLKLHHHTTKRIHRLERIFRMKEQVGLLSLCYSRFTADIHKLLIHIVHIFKYKYIYLKSHMLFLILKSKNHTGLVFSMMPEFGFRCL